MTNVCFLFREQREFRWLEHASVRANENVEEVWWWRWRWRWRRGRVVEGKKRKKWREADISYRLAGFKGEARFANEASMKNIGRRHWSNVEQGSVNDPNVRASLWHIPSSIHYVTVYLFRHHKNRSIFFVFLLVNKTFVVYLPRRWRGSLNRWMTSIFGESFQPLHPSLYSQRLQRHEKPTTVLQTKE